MTAIPALTVIPAGAGSGKTFRIKEQLAEWVLSGRVQPDRIAAVTFTETAASELRDRIRTAIMNQGQLEQALRLDQSFISTIHGFGRRLLVEYAFEAGSCPTPRLLGEDEEQVLLRKAIARIERIEAISRKLHLFGYHYDFNSGTTDVAQFRNRILTTIQLLRIIGGTADRPSRLNHCLNYLQTTYGPIDDGKALCDELRHRVKELLAQYPDCMRDFVNSTSAIHAVENDFRTLQRAAKTRDLEENWNLWKRLQGLKVFKKDDQLPADYQHMARQVMEQAGALHRHPGPLNDAMRHCEILLKSAWDALADYARRKREKGIIDYTDMIDGARMLLEQPGVIDHLAARFDCLIIDEFQDTNPLQFALLWKLHTAGVPAMVVGDLKQSIMGFQSADPRLMANLLSQNPAQCSPLNGNWRSQAKLMDAINAFGVELFGDNYTVLEPRAPYQSQRHPLEVICLEGPGITNPVRAGIVAGRIRDLLQDEKQQIYDRRTKQHRRLRGEDIAILGLTHVRLKEYAQALRELGIRARLAREGWFESRPIQLAYYGLSYVADPQDRHAALYIAVTELGDMDLATAVKTLLNNKDLESSLLEKLRTISQCQDDRPVDELVFSVLEAMDLFDRTMHWPDADQIRANLLRLIDEAGAFVSADREALASGGYYGSGLKTFLAWLANQMSARDGDRQPDAQVHDEDAVQLLTWHAAKGKEWPVVVITTLDRDVKAKLPSLDIQYTDFSDLEHILENARLEFSPNFAASETTDQFVAPLNEKARTEGLNLLYVALTRAREQLILEWQTSLKKSKRYTYWHLLKDTANMQLKANRLTIGDTGFSCRVTTVDRDSCPDFANAEPDIEPGLIRFGRRALKTGPLPENLRPLFVSPSSLHGQSDDGPVVSSTTTAYGRPMELSLRSSAERGLMLHRALELLGQGVDASTVRGLLDMELSDADWEKIQAMVRSFLLKIDEMYHPKRLQWEVPVLAGDHDGTIITGTIDLLAETKDGLIIIDHKSDEPEDPATAFNHYLPQLKCYAQALSEGLGQQVSGMAIHWAAKQSISTHSIAN